MAPQTTIPAEKSLRRRKSGRVLVVFTVDFVGWVLLRPWLIALRDAGFEVHIACSRGAYFERLAGEDFIMHPVPFRRILAPWAHIRPLLELRKLVRQDGFDLINTHGPIASVVAVSGLAGRGREGGLHRARILFSWEHVGPVSLGCNGN